MRGDVRGEAACASPAIACTALQRRAWTVRWGALITATRNVWARVEHVLFPGSCGVCSPHNLFPRCKCVPRRPVPRGTVFLAHGARPRARARGCGLIISVTVVLGLNVILSSKYKNTPLLKCYFPVLIPWLQRPGVTSSYGFQPAPLQPWVLGQRPPPPPAPLCRSLWASAPPRGSRRQHTG